MAVAAGGIAWSWSGPAVLAKHGATYPMQGVYAGLLFDAAAGQSVTLAAQAEGATVESVAVALGAGSSGLADKVQRFSGAVRGRRLALSVSGTWNVRMTMRAVTLGIYTR